MIRPVESDADLDAWVEVKNTVVPNEPTTAQQVRADHEEGRMLYLAERNGRVAGCAIVAPSSFGAKAFIAVRVLRDVRRRGIGGELVRVCADHERTLGLDGVNAFVYADEPHSIAFAESYGLTNVDFQLEQVRVVEAEPAPAVPDGIELVALAGRREELLRALWPVASEGYADMPVPDGVSYRMETWLRTEGTLAEGSFAAFEDGDPVGYAGLSEHAAAGTAEHGLTVVRRDRRGRGIARALKQAQLHWAARNGVRELVTWTQKGNEAMQALNRSLGYVDKAKVITYQGPLP